MLLCLPHIAVYAETKPPEHYQKNCISCHANMTGGKGYTLFQRKDRLVDGLQSLAKRINHCETSLALDWNDKQTASVVDFLNKNFYHFKVKPTDHK